MWHYAFFKKRGVKLMMWHDMLIARKEVKSYTGVTANARGGTEALRRKLPKDITMCMWDYAAVKGGQFTQIDLLRQDGFTVWGAGWFYPDNLEQLTAYAYRKKLPGMIETTWHNKVGSGSLLQTQYPQLKAYIRAAALFWNPRERVKTDPARIYADLMRPEPRPERRVRPLPVRCNTLLTDKRDGFDNLPETLRMNDGMTFKLAKRDGQTGAVMTRSVETPDFPAKVRIPVKAECRKLHLLQTTLSKAVRADNIAVKLVIRYKDGGVEAVWPRNSIDINYGTPPVFRENGRIAERVTEVGTPRAPYTFFMNHSNVFEWKNADGETRRIWYLTWVNPHPDREIDHLLVEAVPNGSSYALLALDMEQ